MEAPSAATAAAAPAPPAAPAAAVFGAHPRRSGGRGGKVVLTGPRPSTPEEAQAVRDAQMARKMAALAAKAAAGGGRTCPACGLVRRVCICRVVAPLPVRHSVTVVIHPCELARTSSTHKLLTRGLQRSHLAVWGVQPHRSFRDVWAGVVAHCAVSGQAPCILFPSPSAVHVADYYASLPPSTRAAGLHMVALDGTWANARCIARQVPLLLEQLSAEAAAAATGGPPPALPVPVCVFVAPRQPHTLFHPLRKQPSPGRVSTVEAVALVLDECRAVDAALPRDAPGLPPPGPGSSDRSIARVGYDASWIGAPLDLLSPSTAAFPHGAASAAADATGLVTPAALLPGGDAALAGALALPPLRCPHANALRRYLMVLVDTMLTQTGEIGPPRWVLRQIARDYGIVPGGANGDAAGGGDAEDDGGGGGDGAGAAPSSVRLNYRGVGYRSWSIGLPPPPQPPLPPAPQVAGGADVAPAHQQQQRPPSHYQPPFTRERYARLLANAQPRGWWRAVSERVTAEWAAAQRAKEGGEGASATDRPARESGSSTSTGDNASHGGSGATAAGIPSSPQTPTTWPAMPAGLRRDALVATIRLPEGEPHTYPGAFAGLPASVVVHIAEFAYGRAAPPGGGSSGSGSDAAQLMAQLSLAPPPSASAPAAGVPVASAPAPSSPAAPPPVAGRVLPSGFESRVPRARRVAWQRYHAQLAASVAAAAGGRSAAQQQPPADDDGGGGDDDAGSDGGSSDSDSDAGGAGGGAAAQPAAASAPAAAGADGAAVPSSRRGAYPSPNVLQLPCLGPHNTFPLALACRELLLLFSGRLGPTCGWGGVSSWGS